MRYEEIREAIAGVQFMSLAEPGPMTRPMRNRMLRVVYTLEWAMRALDVLTRLCNTECLDDEYKIKAYKDANALLKDD